METIERRAAWLTISVVIGLAFDSGTGLAYGFGGVETWELVVYVGGLLCLGAAGVLLVSSLAPASVRPIPLEQRERFVFFAFVLLALAIISIVALGTDAAIHAHQHPQG